MTRPALSPDPLSPGSEVPAAAPRRWWQEPMVWLVIGGPATVVVAGFATLAIALAHPDPVVPDTGRPADSPGRVADAPGTGALTPAVQARNHAATGSR